MKKISPSTSELFARYNGQVKTKGVLSTKELELLYRRLEDITEFVRNNNVALFGLNGAMQTIKMSADFSGIKTN